MSKQQNNLIYAQDKSYRTGFVDWMRDHNIYISSSIGESQTLGPRGQMTIIWKVPITAGSGFVVNDRVVGKHDILSCDKVSLRTLDFRFHDAWGNTTNLNGCHVSFSLVFTSIKEDQSAFHTFQRIFHGNAKNSILFQRKENI